MRTKILAAFIAGGLLVGAGFLTSVISVPGTAQAQEDSDDGFESRGPISHIGGFLGDVLDDLVDDGTITEDQAEAVVEAVEDKVSELRDDFLEHGGLIPGLLDDGVITEEESSELPDDHWLFGDAFDEAWEDGELTVDELTEFRHGPRAHRRGLPFMGPHSLAGILDDGGIDQEEYDNLDDDHPLKQINVDEYLDDGMITLDEIPQILRDQFGSRFGDDA